MAVLSALAHVVWASLEEALGVLLPDTSASWLVVLCSVALVALSSFICPAFYPKLVSIALKQACAPISSAVLRGSYGHLHMEGNAGALFAVQLLPWGCRSLSSSPSSPRYT